MISSLTVINDIYFSDETKAMLRANKEYLISLAQERMIIQLSYVQAHRYDFYRVLRQLGVPDQMHWVIAYINGIEDPNQDIQGMTSFLDLDPSVVDNMITRMNTTRI